MKLQQVEVLMAQGMTCLDAIRQIGVVEQTCLNHLPERDSISVAARSSLLAAIGVFHNEKERRENH
nr:hypothetical protein [uncultured Ruegeria sp.]